MRFREIIPKTEKLERWVLKKMKLSWDEKESGGGKSIRGQLQSRRGVNRMPTLTSWKRETVAVAEGVFFLFSARNEEPDHFFRLPCLHFEGSW